MHAPVFEYRLHESSTNLIDPKRRYSVHLYRDGKHVRCEVTLTTKEHATHRLLELQRRGWY